METSLNYGNWIRKKILVILGLCALGMGGLTLIPWGTFYRLVTFSLFIILLISFLFPLYSYIMFSQRGGRIQEKVYNLIISRLEANPKGKVLDIGSGNGVLAVKLAQQKNEVEVLSIDYWGKNWEYSKGVCEKNAHTAKVERQVQFRKGDAAKLDFASDTFDGAISNLTFHEVQSVTDKREVVREALRVLKPGGGFAFVDYFYEEKYYGKASEFEGYLKGLGLSQFEYKPLREMMAMPVLLKHPKILGRVGIVWGLK